MSNNVSLYNIHRSCTMYRAVSSMYICPNSLLYIQGEVVQFSKCSSEGSVVFLEMNMDTPYECALINRKLRSRNIFITVQSYAEYSYTRNMHTSGKNESSLIHCSRERAHHQKSCRRCSAVCRCSPAPTVSITSDDVTDCPTVQSLCPPLKSSRTWSRHVQLWPKW